MHTLSLYQLITALQKRSISSVELTTYYLQRIQQKAQLNAFIHVNEAQALMAATHADTLLKQGQAPLLAGIPFAHKDNFCTKNMPTTCASKMLDNFTPPYDATIVNRFNQQGAVLLGKTNLDEFAMGSSNESSFFGAVKNPWDTTRMSGGSSGGSAASVAARLIPFATGSDTGGSIRQPAAFCGISGLKPTYGLVSRFGMVAYASSLDQAGPMAPSAEDLSIILQVMAGFDENDSTSVQTKIPNYLDALNKPIQGVRIGIPSYWLNEHPIDASIQQAISQAINVFKQAGAIIVDIDLLLESLWSACYYIIACAEASSNLARFDGVRFGYQAANTKTIRELITRSRDESFGTEVKRRILTGTHLLSASCFDDYYVQAQKVRWMIQQEIIQALSTVDVILSPTTTTCALKLGETFSDPTHAYRADSFTVAANLGGFPAISIPAGFDENLPIGMQLLSAHFREDLLLNLAHFYQQATDWHRQVPKVDTL